MDESVRSSEPEAAEGTQREPLLTCRPAGGGAPRRALRLLRALRLGGAGVRGPLGRLGVHRDQLEVVGDDLAVVGDGLDDLSVARLQIEEGALRLGRLAVAVARGG